MDKHQYILHELKKDYNYERVEEMVPVLIEMTQNDLLAQLEVLSELCTFFLRMGKLVRANEMYVNASKLSSQSTLDSQIEFTLMEANYYAYQNKVELSNEKADLILSLLGGTCSLSTLRAFSVKVTNHIVSRNFDEAIRLANVIIAKSTSMDSMKLMALAATSHTNLGLVFIEIKRWKEAEANFQDSLILYERLGYKRFIAGTYSNFGLLAERSSNDTRKAIEYTKRALSIVRSSSDTFFLPIILSNLAHYYAIVGDFDEAFEYGNESLKVSEKSGLGRSIAISLEELGDIFIRNKNFNAALETLEKIFIYEDLLEAYSVVRLYRQLSTCCTELGLFEKGNHYLWKLNTLQRDWDEKSNQALLYHQGRIETESREQEKKLLHLELEKKETQLANSAIHLATQTELLGKFRNKLRHIVREIEEPIAALRRIKEELKTLPCESVDWREFEEQFISVHPEFRAKLVEKYPDLTKQEVKMCQFARLGLKNIEMAQLLCLSERSVESHRYNLRKKLGLKTEENLMKFLGDMR